MEPRTRSDQVRSLFDRAAEVPPSGLEAVFQNALAEGIAEDVVQEVRSLIAGGPVGTRTSGAEPPSRQEHRAKLEHLYSLANPEKIGPYPVEQCLGEGTFGVVYRARQIEPVRRTVAIKVLKTGLFNSERISRFRREQRALAVMNHPNVASVLDADMNGHHPYLVMEYVEGKAITAFCDERRLSIRERLTLFIDVCEGVQHAHNKGIIHRDLSPANVLAFETDGRRTAKIIDFGVSKLTQDDDDQASLSEAGQRFGTPLYMSPEQAGHPGVDVDTRSDVYSLGVILYELLAGLTPVDKATLVRLSPAARLKHIAEAPPLSPSRRLSSAGSLAAEEIAAARTQLAKHLTRQLRAELDWIPLKAMRREPDRRYGSAAELAEDIRRYLRREPLQAGPESSVYRARKLVARNRGITVAAAVAVVSLVAAGVQAVQSRIHIATERLVAQRSAEALGQIVQRAIANEQDLAEQRMHAATAAQPGTDAEAVSGGESGVTTGVVQTLTSYIDRFNLARSGDRSMLDNMLGDSFAFLWWTTDAGLSLRSKIYDRTLAALGPDHPDTICALMRRTNAEAECAFRRGDFAALGQLGEALSAEYERLRNLVPANDRRIRAGQLALATVWNDLELFEQTLAFLGPERQRSTPFDGADATDRVQLYMTLGQAVSSENTGDGCEILGIGYRLATQTFGNIHAVTLEAQFQYASSLRGGDTDGQAHTLMAEGRQVAAAAYGETHPFVSLFITGMLCTKAPDGDPPVEQLLEDARLASEAERRNYELGLTRQFMGHQWYANYLKSVGEVDKAMEVQSRAVALTRRVHALADNYPLVVPYLDDLGARAERTSDPTLLAHADSIWLEFATEIRYRRLNAGINTGIIRFACSAVGRSTNDALPHAVQSCSDWLAAAEQQPAAAEKFAWCFLSLRGLAYAKMGRRDEAMADLKSAEVLVDRAGGLLPGAEWVRNSTKLLIALVGTDEDLRRWEAKTVLPN